MAITDRSSAATNFGGITNTPTIANVTAQTGDWIYVTYAWRGTGGGGGTNVVLSGAPTWNSQTFTQVGTTLSLNADTGLLQLAIYRVKAASNATSSITQTFAASQFANCVAGYVVKVGLDGTAPNDTPITQNVWTTYSNPTLSPTSLVAGDEIMEFLADMGWDSSFNNVSGSTWSPANTQTNVFDQQFALAAGAPRVRYDKKSGTGTVPVGYTVSTGQPGYLHVAMRLVSAVVGAVLSSPTPSGTLGTATTASIGATTTQASGSGFGILSTVSSQVTSATATQIKAGQINTGAAAPFAVTQPTISTTTISMSVTGLSAGTTYYYAIVQNNSNGDSNIVTGSFTTAALAPSSAFNFDCASTGVAATTFAVDAGSSRAVIAVLSHEQTVGTRPVASLVVGGATFQKLTDAIFGQGTSYAYTEIWYCLEAAIASIGANPSVTVTATSTGNKFVSGTLFTIANIQQSAASWVAGTDAKAIGTDLSATITTVSGRQIVGGATASIGGSGFTTGASVTEITGSDRNFNTSASRAVSFYGVASGTSTTVTTGNTNSNTAQSQSMVAVAFPALSGRSVGITLRDAGAVGQPLLNGQTRKFWTRTTLDGVAIDGGTAGISLTCGTDGVFILSGLTIAAGAGFLTIADPADPNKSHNYSVTYV